MFVKCLCCFDLTLYTDNTSRIQLEVLTTLSFAVSLIRRFLREISKSTCGKFDRYIQWHFSQFTLPAGRRGEIKSINGNKFWLDFINLLVILNSNLIDLQPLFCPKIGELFEVKCIIYFYTNLHICIG